MKRVQKRGLVLSSAVLGSQLIVGWGAAGADAQTYYVNALTGNDNNSGLSPSQPWASVTKVDDTTFAPGSTILFAAGQNFYTPLVASSSGTASAPITYSDYGSGPNPVFWGSNTVASSSFQPYADIDNNQTYVLPSSTPINSFLVNHQFANSAVLISGQTSDAANINYVESTPNTWYYATDTGQLYVNPGAPVTPADTYSVAVRQNMIQNNVQSNLIFDNLTTDETANYTAGYGISIQWGSNITVENCSTIGAGKHGVGAIDVNNFTGENLTASNFMPYQGYGGSSAYVTYADDTVSNISNTWINCSFTNPNGAYPVFITHASPGPTDPTPIASVTANDLYSYGGQGFAVYTSGNETVSINGGNVGSSGLYGNNTVVNGVEFSGTNSELYIQGQDNIVENSIMTGDLSDTESGHDAAVAIDGTDEIFRFNTVNINSQTTHLGAAIALQTADTSAQIYGNIFQTTQVVVLEKQQGAQASTFLDNLYSQNPDVDNSYNQLYADVITNGSVSYIPMVDWTDASNVGAIYANANFINANSQDYFLLPTSPAVNAITTNALDGVPTDFYAISRTNPTNLGAIGFIPIWSGGGTLGNWSNPANWGGAAPSAGFPLVFAGTAQLAPSNDFPAGTEFSDVVFAAAAGPFNLAGNSISLAGDISNTGTVTQTVGLNVALQQNANLWAIPGNLVVNGQISGAYGITVPGTGTVTLFASNSYTGGTTANGGTLILASTRALPTSGTLTIGSNGFVQLNSGIGTLTIPSLQMAAGGTLDVTSNAVLINYAGQADPIGQIKQYLADGLANQWLSGGIISSAVVSMNAGQSRLLYTIGYADGADGIVPGLSSGEIEIMPTLAGDAKLDGSVDFGDFQLMAQYFGQSGGWDEGNFNYGPTIGFGAFQLFAQNFGATSGMTAGELASINQFASQFGEELAPDPDGGFQLISVPEPASAALLAAAGFGLLARRRRG
jgi:hypothetical protein